jgi:hypothetical protein
LLNKYSLSKKAETGTPDPCQVEALLIEMWCRFLAWVEVVIKWWFYVVHAGQRQLNRKCPEKLLMGLYNKVTQG